MAMASPVDEEHYRREQEAFVSNHGGATPGDIICTLLPTGCGVLLTATVLGVFRNHTHRNVRVLIEFVLTVVPTILCCTVLSDHFVAVCFVMLFIAALLSSRLVKRNLYDMFRDIAVMRPVAGVRRPFVTNFRALTNMITAICILAVDFRIFPRKFAKTETYGYSLMDTGVGLFIFANALVAPEARELSGPRQVGFREVLKRNMRNCIRSCLPLLLVGVGRAVIVEYISYQKHVTEYGTHWNFFLTLAAVKLLTNMIVSTINTRYSLLLLSGVWILGMHEYILNTTGLKTWVLSDESRTDFFSANREGLISIPGYVGLYFVGVALGRLIHSSYRNSPKECMLPRVSLKLPGVKLNTKLEASLLLFANLCLISASSYIVTLFCERYFNVSRRLANVGYCAWILTLTTVLLQLLLFVELLADVINCVSPVESKKERLRSNLRLNLKSVVESKRKEDDECAVRRTLEIFDAVNYNGLFFFLLSNLLTGLVNMSVYTLYATETMAILILVIYMAVNVFSILILYRLQISFKL